MRIINFKGGVHPLAHKDETSKKKIEKIDPKEIIKMSLCQHIGKPSKAIINVNDYVLVGQCIAISDGFVSASVFSSVSGTVRSIDTCLSVTGNKVPCIIIENDFLYNKVEREELTTAQLNKDIIINRIQSYGIVGMGGAGFPTHVKLSPKDRDSIDTLIINGAECEPYITGDTRLLLEKAESFLEGLEILLLLFDHAKVVVVIEDNKKECIHHLKSLNKNINIEILCVKTKYPQGSERQLIYTVTNKAIHQQNLPSDVGCIVLNVATIIAIKEAVLEDKPLYERVMTISGDTIVHPGNYLVPLGMSHREVLDSIGGCIVEPNKIIYGGPMMGFSLPTLDVPITKTSGALLCFVHNDVSSMNNTACISCDKCVEVCPSNISPATLYRFSIQKNEEAFVKYHGLECIECGCCSYICPAKNHLKQTIAYTKREILMKRRK